MNLKCMKKGLRNADVEKEDQRINVVIRYKRYLSASSVTFFFNLLLGIGVRYIVMYWRGNFDLWFPFI